MGYYTGSTFVCEYTVLRSGKKVKKGKIGLQKSSFWAKSAKNDPNPENQAP
jgi:hypothetical protein